MSSLQRLAQLGHSPVGTQRLDLSQLANAFGPRRAEQLGHLLDLQNGFYAFESALHVLSGAGLLDWNREDLWRSAYEGMADGAVFFAEDVFGTQFCLREDIVATFDPETGAFETMASSLEHWAQLILDDHAYWTGHPLAHDWQAAHGPLPVGSRLLPVTPFVLGGEYTLENLRAIVATEGMRYRASIAHQIRDLPDGAQIELRVVD